MSGRDVWNEPSGGAGEPARRRRRPEDDRPARPAEPDLPAVAPEAEPGSAANRTADAPAVYAPSQAAPAPWEHNAPAEADAGGLRSWAQQQEHLRRYTDHEHLYTYVEQVAGLFGTVSDLVDFNSELRLTRDPDTYQADRARMEEMVAPYIVRQDIRLPGGAANTIVLDMVYDELVGIGPLGELWRDDEVLEIFVNAWDDVRAERQGQRNRTMVRFRDHEHAMRLARTLSQKISDRPVTPANPIVTAELERARVQFVVGEAAKSGLVITIRKFRPLLGMRELLNFGSLSQPMADFLSAAVRARATILISGSTGAGKTTLINAVSEFIPSSERVVTIEDLAELKLGNDHVVSFQTKESVGEEDRSVVTMDQLIVASLRLAPDRIIVGEVREEQAAEAMLQAAATGHDGTMTTIHANSAAEALNDRLVDLARGQRSEDVVRRRVANAIDIAVQVVRGRQDRKFISEIALVDRSGHHEGLIAAEPLFVGEQQPDGTPHFRQAGGLRADTALAVRMRDADIDPARWQQ